MTSISSRNSLFYLANSVRTSSPAENSGVHSLPLLASRNVSSSLVCVGYVPCTCARALNEIKPKPTPHTSTASEKEAHRIYYIPDRRRNPGNGPMRLLRWQSRFIIDSAGRPHVPRLPYAGGQADSMAKFSFSSARPSRFMAMADQTTKSQRPTAPFSQGFFFGLMTASFGGTGRQAAVGRPDVATLGTKIVQGRALCRASVPLEHPAQLGEEKAWQPPSKSRRAKSVPSVPSTARTVNWSARFTSRYHYLDEAYQHQKPRIKMGRSGCQLPPFLRRSTVTRLRNNWPTCGLRLGPAGRPFSFPCRAVAPPI